MKNCHSDTRHTIFLGQIINKRKCRLVAGLLVILVSFISVKSFGAYSVNGVAVSASQTGTLTYGTAGSATYVVTLNMGGGGGGNTLFTLNWTTTPAGVSFTPSASVSLTGNGQTVTLTLSSGSTTPAGNYSFTVTSSNGNRTSGTASFVILAAPLTITATNQTKTYGTNLTLGTSAFTVSSLKNSDAVTGVNLTSAGAANTANVGTYPIVPASAVGTGLSNYTINYTSGTLTVNQKAIMVSGAVANSKTYDGNASTTVTGGILSGIVNGDAVNIASTGTFSQANAGSNLVVTLALTGSGSANYTLVQPGITADITQATLTIKANNVSKPYGNVLTSNSTNAFTATGLQNGETIGSITRIYGSGAAASDPVGSYPGSVIPSAPTGGTFTITNYLVTFTNGTLAVTKRSTTTTVTSSLNPACTGSTVTFTATVTSAYSNYTGTLDFYEGATLLGSFPVVSGQASVNMSGLSIGTHTITATYSGDGNYNGSTSSSFSQTVSDIATISNAGPDQTGTSTCGLTSVTLAANIPAIGSGMWSIVSGAGGSFSDNTNPSATFMGVSGSTYILAWTISSNPCAASSSQVTIKFNATPTVTQPANLPVCNGSLSPAIVFSGTGTTYNWTNDQSGIGLGATGTGDIPSFLPVNNGTAPIVANIIVTPEANGCVGTPKNFTITANPIPNVVATPANGTFCSASSISVLFSGNVSGATFGWNRDNPAGLSFSGAVAPPSGTGDLSGTVTNTLSVPVTTTFQVTPSSGGCPGTTIPVPVVINPKPTVNTVSNQNVCNNTTTNAVNFSGSGTSYNWTNSNTAIGLSAATGAGNIAAFTGTNIGTALISSSLVVTPVYTYGGLDCFGNTKSFTISVKPTPTLSSTLTPAPVCSGSVFSYTPTSLTASTSFSWSRAFVTGITNGASSGSGAISETLVNSTNAPIDVTYVYTLTAGSCTNPSTFSVTVSVKPTPAIAITPSANQSICTGSAMTMVTLSNPGSLAGTTLSWARTNGAISSGNIQGIAASGSTNTIGGSLTNTAGTIQTTVFTATASNPNGCAASTTFNVQVNPVISNNTITTGATTVSEIDVCSLTKQVTISTGDASGGDGTYTYQWQASIPGGASFVNIPGATGASLVYQYPQTNAFFRRIAYSDGCAADISDEVHLNKPSGAITLSAAGGNSSGGGHYCAGGSGVSITITPSLLTATYTLQRNTVGSTWVDVGATMPGNGGLVSFNNVTTAGTYRVHAVISSGSENCTQDIGNIAVIIDAVPAAPAVNSPAAICAGNSANIIGTLAGFSINWYATSTGGTALNASPLASGTSYSVSPANTTSYYAEALNTTTGCVSASRTPLSLTVNQRPVLNSAASAAVCSGGTVNIPFTNNVNAGATYTWIASNNPNTTGESLTTQNSSTLSNTLTSSSGSSTIVSYNVAATYPAGCTGPTQVVQVTVDPKPSVVTAQNVTVCGGTGFAISPANGGGNVIPTTPATTYTWSSAPTGTGFTGGAAGSGTTINGNLLNTTNGQVTATYSVTPTAGSCAGSSFTATVTVNPKPSVIPQTVAVCSGTSYTITPADGGGNIVPSNTLYTWGLPTGSNISNLGSGAGQSSFTGAVTNISSPGVPVTATYSVTPTGPVALGACPGTPFAVTATINPIPSANVSVPGTVCENGTANLTFTGSNGTAPYTFTYKINGAGSYTATSVGNTAIVMVPTTATGSFTYNLIGVQDNSSTGCSQVLSTNATIVVNPQPVIGPQANLTTCSGSSALTPAISGTTIPPGTTYTWAAPIMTGGMTGGSTGTNQASFTTGVFSNTTTAIQTATYTITPNSGSGCPGTPFSLVVNVSPVIAGTAVWLGTANNDWCTSFNWSCGIVPSAFTNVIIPNGAPNSTPVKIDNSCTAYALNINVENGAQLSVVNNGYLNIFGNFLNTTDPLMYSFGGTVDFAGGTGGIGGNQSIPAFTYNNLRVSGGSVKTLAGSVRVSKTLILQDGIVVSTPTKMLTVSSTGDITNASNNSYIDGPLTRETNSTNSYSFPVGAGGAVRFATVQPASSLSSSYTVYYHSSNLGGMLLGPDLAGVQTNEYWDVTRNNGADAVPGFYYRNPNGLPANASTTDWSSGVNPCVACNVAVVEKESSGNVYFTGGAGYIGGYSPSQTTYWTSNGFVDGRIPITANSTYQYSFGYAFSSVLPIRLLTFTGILQGNDGQLEWKVAEVDDLTGTELQHSTNGIHFNKLALIEVTGSANYHYTHQNLQPGSHYYRLLLKDKSGNVSFSKTVLLISSKEYTEIKGLRPNLVRLILILKYMLHGSKELMQF